MYPEILARESAYEELRHASCKWECDDDGIYQTECDEAFVFETDGPKENSFKFCCFCGKNLIEAKETSEC